ncbi:hypothetical protein ADL22_00310 [Streptomyces sp. NRRL F-4489]|uniref:DUF202 domain-containing protein n=1 Tax=Streptomyces sp. NRRL F-4489 TaxID=1609095 RepID=UPI000747B921|nr:DUF202 domain-containing protein [Streptomyces sp. NRRL F-4489]KUL55376.1 hypothetical protein ADL22_00310 [Streptomyces sp. NRRL F-4489]
MTARLPDPGLQNERTALAWMRTTLSLLAAAAITTRLALPARGAAVLAILSADALPALYLFTASARRYRGTHRALHRGTALPDARLPLLLTAITVQNAVVALLYVQ